METSRKFSKLTNILFCIMYKFHNSYFVIFVIMDFEIWGFLYFVYFYILYIFIFCIFLSFIYFVYFRLPFWTICVAVSRGGAFYSRPVFRNLWGVPPWTDLGLPWDTLGPILSTCWKISGSRFAPKIQRFQSNECHQTTRRVG